jgi:hypothetical protein
MSNSQPLAFLAGIRYTKVVPSGTMGRPAARGGPRGVTGSPCERMQASGQGWPQRRYRKPLRGYAGHRQGMAPEALPEALARVRRPPARDGPRGVTGSPCEGTQATRQGWPYYTRRLGKRPDRLVYSRATPGHPPGVALLYTTARQEARPPRI